MNATDRSEMRMAATAARDSGFRAVQVNVGDALALFDQADNSSRLLKALQDLLLAVESHSKECECSQCDAESAACRLLEELGEEVK